MEPSSPGVHQIFSPRGEMSSEMTRFRLRRWIRAIVNGCKVGYSCGTGCFALHGHLQATETPCGAARGHRKGDVLSRHADQRTRSRELAEHLPSGRTPLAVTDAVYPPTGAISPLSDRALASRYATWRTCSVWTTLTPCESSSRRTKGQSSIGG